MVAPGYNYFKGDEVAETLKRLDCFELLRMYEITQENHYMMLRWIQTYSITVEYNPSLLLTVQV